MSNERFQIPLLEIKAEGGDFQQYCNIYFNRLKQLKPHVKEAAELKWAQHDAVFVDNILDMQQKTTTVIIGTLFKEQKLKPNVFSNITGAINAVSAVDCSFGGINGKFASEDDYAVLEDASGRVQIRESANFSCNRFVTGSIVALIGRVDTAGYFVCEDHCFAGIPFRPQLPQNID
jgi:hypothetical protein